MKREDLQKLIEQCNANEAALRQQLDQAIIVREMAQNTLSEMDKAAVVPEEFNDPYEGHLGEVA